VAAHPPPTVLPYIIRRLLWTVFLLFVVSGLTFIIFYVMPTADPAALRAGKSPTPEAVATVRKTLGLDRPPLEQYASYMGDVFTNFDFGRSYVSSAEVRPLILSRLPNTLFLIVGAVVVWLAVGLTVGTISAVRRGSVLDRLAMGSALIAISAPVYWLGLVVLFLFSDDIGRFPLLPGSGAYESAEGFLAKCEAMIMPWCVLATAFAAVYARLLRANLVEVLGEDYIRTARAKGLRERRVIVRHGIRSAITPVVTVLGLDIGILLGGAILTESVFNIPGVGRLAFDAIQRGDLTMIQGTTLFFALGVCLMNLIVDIAYGFLDPRVRY
jgi:peptide/nickel transport system permease protein